MYGFGDDQDPLDESVELLRNTLVQFIAKTVIVFPKVINLKLAVIAPTPEAEN